MRVREREMMRVIGRAVKMERVIVIVNSEARRGRW